MTSINQKRATRALVLCASAAFLLTGCGGGGGDDSNAKVLPCNGVTALVTLGLACIVPIIDNRTPPPEPPPPPTSPPPTSPPPAPAPAADRFNVVADVEPNDSISTASVATFPTRSSPEQRVGFHVNGTINNLTDGIDTFAFTSAQPRVLRFELCARGDSCLSPGRLNVGIAFLAILDQFGTTLWSSEGGAVDGNIRHMRIDAGVLYYVMVVAEYTMNDDQDYLLSVVETTADPDPAVAQDPDAIPNPPILSVSGAPSLTITLDWLPPGMNPDDSALLNLSGYSISFANVSGPCCGNYPTTNVDLDNPGLVTYVLDLPGPGEWAISMTARNSTGQESVSSNVVTATVGDPSTIAVPGQIISYSFSTGASPTSIDPALTALVSGLSVSGTFDYDNSALQDAKGAEYTGYLGGMANLTGSVNGMTYFGPATIVSNDRYGSPMPGDFLHVAAGASNFAGFETSGYTLMAVRIFWIEGQLGISDFLTSENLPTELPRFEGRLALDFVSTADASVQTSVFFDGVFVTQVH